jgi:uncharacterized protein (DUF1501 family)
MLVKRREFLQMGSLATASMMVPNFLKAFEQKAPLVPPPPGNKVLVVLQLSGGNDGLNTVVPVRNDIYYKERPRLAISKDTALGLTDDAGLNPALLALKGLYDAGNLAILNSVGYPDPDRSHFRSMDIWHTASASNQYLNTGWLGKYLDHQCNNCDKPTQALELDDVLSLALKGEQVKGLALTDPKKLFSASQDKYFQALAQQHRYEHERPVDYLYKTMAATISSADYIYQQSRQRPSAAAYPNSNLGRHLKTIGSLIFSDINTKVYYVSIGSFDTHIGQEGTQRRLFTEISDALQAFTNDLKANNRFNDVLLMTFSEFGRRVSQNASGGTDHGTAGNMFFVSGGLKQQGLLNGLPNLGDLNEGDLKYQVDFKSVYATVLKKWLGADDKAILGKQYEYLKFI